MQGDRNLHIQPPGYATAFRVLSSDHLYLCDIRAFYGQLSRTPIYYASNFHN